MKRLAPYLAAALLLAPLHAALGQQPTPQPAPPPSPAGQPARADSVAVRPDTAQGRGLADTTTRARSDSIRPVPPVTPTGAFLRSLVLPGWGQARLGRNVTGGLFIAFEGVAAAMVWKTYWQLDLARARNHNVKSHTQEREDWLVLLAFNHLFAGAEAYVSAHLYDFPAALKIQLMPDGRTGVGIQLPLPHGPAQ